MLSKKFDLLCYMQIMQPQIYWTNIKISEKQNVGALNKNKQCGIYTSFRNTYASSDIFQIFTVDVLHTNLICEQKRLFVETCYINTNRQYLMNGCVSMMAAV